MKQKRPINLNLLTIRQPVPAIASILHRISGVILFLLLPLFIWMLSESLGSEFSFNALQKSLSFWGFKLLLWVALSALAYHLVAGIRHLIMDLGVCESLPCARMASYFTLIISAILAISLGVWLC
ncbi:MAG: sdhC [Gammaproteobacteria bacterium]|jgi:succinate dehydrogenase / fumarate reductase cytochrome b subunit|nr:sdhC [Gammaproteobacteria bacterium]